MNKTLTFFLLLYLLACDRSAKKLDYTSMNFNKTSHKFGEIKYKEDAQFSFQFENAGKSPLIISEVTSSCGCTAVNHPQKPINPGKKDSIIVSYDTFFPGVFSKSIKVHYNGKDSPIVLQINGRVNFPK